MWEKERAAQRRFRRLILTVVANITLNMPYQGIDFSASIYNLFDEGYEDPGAVGHRPIVRIPQNGRNFYVKMSGHL